MGYLKISFSIPNYFYSSFKICRGRIFHRLQQETGKKKKAKSKTFSSVISVCFYVSLYARTRRPNRIRFLRVSNEPCPFDDKQTEIVTPLKIIFDLLPPPSFSTLLHRLSLRFFTTSNNQTLYIFTFNRLQRPGLFPSNENSTPPSRAFCQNYVTDA